jgi:hypothetical protein
MEILPVFGSMSPRNLTPRLARRRRQVYCLKAQRLRLDTIFEVECPPVGFTACEGVHRLMPVVVGFLQF